MKKRNPKRRQSEFARCYHSKERVEFVRALNCVACAAKGRISTSQSDNAHVENGGAGRKAGYDKIAPLCRIHHQQYDQHQFPFDTGYGRMIVQLAAEATEKLWLAHTQRSEDDAA